ncbi:MAG: hypothetical protein GX424_11010 [Clostridiales bacterium]|jgi:hypothetical protein|nr:hypothetical protein [Clostridiales bacterium]
MLDEYPIGFGLTLAMNAKAMEKFSAMPEEKQRKIIEQTHQVSSKGEMQALVQSIADGKQNTVG